MTGIPDFLAKHILTEHSLIQVYIFKIYLDPECLNTVTVPTECILPYNK